MKYSLVVVAAAVSALALSACDQKPKVAPDAPPANVVTVPGPQGPAGSQGPTGAPGMTGAEGEKGQKDQTGVNTVVPAPSTR